MRCLLKLGCCQALPERGTVDGLLSAAFDPNVKLSDAFVKGLSPAKPSMTLPHFAQKFTQAPAPSDTARKGTKDPANIFRPILRSWASLAAAFLAQPGPPWRAPAASASA